MATTRSAESTATGMALLLTELIAAIGAGVGVVNNAVAVAGLVGAVLGGPGGPGGLRYHRTIDRTSPVID